MITDSDIAVAIVVALILLIIVLGVWPGILRVRPRDLEGYWAGTDGKLRSIKALSPKTFVVAAPGDPSTPGHISGLRGVALPTARGTVDLGGRRIKWSDGQVWTLQGVH
jgi:hypothetical protein